MPRVNLAVAADALAALSEPREVLSLDPSTIEFTPETNVRLGAVGTNEPGLIAALAASLKATGQAQPILVRRNASGGYSVIAGRRRVQAAGEAGINVLAVVHQCDDETARRLAFEENYRRKQMSPIEFALNIRAYRERNVGNAIAVKIGHIADYFQVSPAQITQMEKLLKLPEDVQTQVHEGLAVDAAFTLAKVDPAAREDVMKIATEKARQEPKKGKPERVPPNAEQKAAFKSVKEAAKHDRETKAKVQTKHVVAAARETETLTSKKTRNRNEILAGMEALSGPGIPEVMNKFIDFLVGSYAPGEAANDTGLRNRWNEIAWAVEKKGAVAVDRGTASKENAKKTVERIIKKAVKAKSKAAAKKKK